MIAGKVWGETRLLLRTPFTEVHLVDVRPMSFCSMHRHDRKWNAFVLIEGELTVEIEKLDYDLTDRTVLRARGETATVKPGEFHRFVTGPAGATALEIYYPESLSEDIVRRDSGGVLTPSPPAYHPV